MIEKLRRDRVGLGLIGLGPSWESTYRETLVRLQSRLSIRLVYDSVEARATAVASEVDADVAGSIREVLSRPTLQGLLVFDLGWCGAGALRLIASSGKPVYLANPVLQQVSTSVSTLLNEPLSLGETKHQSSTADDLLMPELSLRFTPASCRLRELVATKLGTVCGIQIEGNLSQDQAKTVQFCDWCCHIMGDAPTRVTGPILLSSTSSSFDLEFAPTPATSNPRVARLIHLFHATDNVRTSIQCEHGLAVITDRTKISWQTSAESADESLAEERSEIDILIDQFCRRAVGGLNPIGRLSDYARALEIAEKCLVDFLRWA